MSTYGAGFAIFAALVFNLPVAAPAQRTIDLTGHPAAALAEEFSSITSFREVAPGKAVIADMMEDRLVLADLSAGRVSAVGRKGNGPGEWSLPFDIIQGPRPGTVSVLDMMSQRSHVVDASGRIVESVAALGPSSSSGTTGGITLGGRTRNDARGRIYREAIPRMTGSGGTIDSVPLTRWDPASERLDTVAWVPSGRRISVSRGAVGAGRSGAVSSAVGNIRPFAATTVWEVLPDGEVVLVHGDPYRVDFIADGRVRKGSPIRYTPIRVTGAERDAYREARRSSSGMAISIGGGSVTREQLPGPQDQIPDSDFPDRKAPFAGSNAVKVSPSGQIWVARSRAHDDPTPRYDIIDDTGRVVAEARLRPHYSVVGFGADNAVYVSRTDPETDIKYLEMYRLP